MSLRRSFPTSPVDIMSAAVALAMAVIVAAAGPARADGTAAAARPDRAVVHRGAIMLPDRAPDATGREVGITGLSGIAWLGDDAYVAVMDNSDTLLRFRLRLSQVGMPLEAVECRVVRLSARHDYEDVAVCPDAVAYRLQTAQGEPPRAIGGPFVFLAEEDTPAIRLASLETGELLAEVPLPANLRSRRPNRGNESLAIDPLGRWLWTANEEALTTDGEPAAIGRGTVVRLTRVPLADKPAAAAAAAGSGLQAAYGVEPPHPFARVFPGEPLSGLVAVVDLGDGTVLAMERSGCPGLPPFSNRVFVVAADRAEDVSTVARDLAGRRDRFVAKRLLWEDRLGLNLEGLCLGPPLADGNRALVAVADNGGLGTPNQLVTFGLVTPAPPPEPVAIGATAAIVAVAVLAGRLRGPRLTSP